ncbi:MAG: hypothetical protein A3F82_04700 [Deltaproteobacteria bacterium RIFCSPLOWO2_12_FULL_44_12]|nr:MAG: hypothetical protein A2712_05750 [Deltaproteobacteria bacterium RIFCSPHIGHO2_01_FULL_43_49]OGQ16636.1 MAG: hypothetical protein A3D22_06875 [Deltaproteobacteria bacterium RIFCSPHIGHO2_02_FULL_44_53]OGQ29774.1 MAG: hypothetical protein A3D98_09540 [Deltaproteobacteria bacterium RIFCSPHIGHO2_12_FULL_44_21]OGQ33064.1 MAG: hypothetical protein A2979_03520 [Deltaproteobacteria bacterium RIFCSPLOWO2_01_FULL_45_74]OGQ42159.1 MAG: hypothetical protein A3I70_05825 [Deltaproteobacteria bacterium 
MYETYWRFDFKPFENTPDPKFLYYSPKHEEALMRLLYAAREHKQGAILTGEYGSGKTLVSRVLLQDLASDDRFQTVLIVNPKLSNKELLKEILFQIGEQNIASSNDALELLHQLERRLKESIAQRKKTVFIIDEAQILEEKELEELRLLLNFQNQEEFLMTMILIGQSDLKRRVNSIEPLKQRLALQYHLNTLGLEETREYINHRLGIVGRREPIFTPGAYGLIHEGAQGTPRKINNVCDYALLIGFSKKAQQIGVEIVEDCLYDLGFIEKKIEKKTSATPKKTRARKTQTNGGLQPAPLNTEEEQHGEDSRHFEEGERGIEGFRRDDTITHRRVKTP